MAKLQYQFTISNCKTLDDVKRYTSASLDEIQSLVNGKLTLVDNLQGSGPLTAAIGTTPVAISHSLNRVPSGYLVISQDAGATIYRPNVAQYPWSPNKIFLAASAPVNATLYVI